MTCFYCNYSVSDWEPTDDPWCAVTFYRLSFRGRLIDLPDALGNNTMISRRIAHSLQRGLKAKPSMRGEAKMQWDAWMML